MSEAKHLAAAAITPATATALNRQRALGVLGVLFGLFLIFGVGFANPEAIHNAAHDSRHAFAFPCH